MVDRPLAERPRQNMWILAAWVVLAALGVVNMLDKVFILCFFCCLPTVAACMLDEAHRDSSLWLLVAPGHATQAPHRSPGFPRPQFKRYADVQTFSCDTDPNDLNCPPSGVQIATAGALRLPGRPGRMHVGSCGLRDCPTPQTDCPCTLARRSPAPAVVYLLIILLFVAYWCVGWVGG